MKTRNTLLVAFMVILVLLIRPLVFGDYWNPGYNIDFLEPGNPGGWTNGLKTWDETWTLSDGEEIYADIWAGLSYASLITGGFWLEYNSNISITSVEVYDGVNGPFGPWESGITLISANPGGPGTYMVGVGNLATVPPDEDGDFLLGRITVRSESPGDAVLTVKTIPGFDTFVADSSVYDHLFSPRPVTIHQRECTINADCNDGLWCTATDICNNGLCVRTPRDCSAAGDQCNNGVCNENTDSCVKQPKANGTPCNDGIVCNGSDSCSGGSCSAHMGGPCEFCSSYGCSCDATKAICAGCEGDDDCDGVCNAGETGPFCSGSDNCTQRPNGPQFGSCTRGSSIVNGLSVCTAHGECGTNGYCSTAQEDSYPPEGNGIGDACECESDFNCDRDTDGGDAATFKEDFGRSPFNSLPCGDQDPCDGDFSCDGDVDGSDAAKFKEDFGRFPWYKPCPPCVVGPWCSYP